MDYKLLHFTPHSDERGSLIAIQHDDEIPFLVKRMYAVYNVPPNARRGYHAHKHLHQVCVCISGSCKMFIKDKNESHVIVLDSPETGLYLGNNIWREMFDFSENAVLIVLASEPYDADDYIRNFDEL